MKIEIVSGPDFYDNISAEYNEMVVQYPGNNDIRTRTAKYFLSVVPEGIIMDFGGGTGLDLPWLTKSYEVIFCEPSAQMRQIAMASCAQFRERVTFLEGDNNDFTTWPSAHSFIGETVTGILANFGVFNCIQNLQNCLEQLASISQANTRLLANVIDTSFFYLLKNYPAPLVKSVLSGKIKAHTRYGNIAQTTYLHTLPEIKKACAPFFSIEDIVSMHGFGFNLIHLKRK